MSRKQKRTLSSVLVALVLFLVLLGFGFLRPVTGGLISRAAPSKALSSPEAATNTNSDRAAAVLPATVVTGQIRGPISNVRFTLTDVGVYPRELHTHAGNVGITMEDRTATSTGLMVEQANGNSFISVGEVQPVT